QPAQPPVAGSSSSAAHYGRTPLSDLIGRGEGGYDSFNRGRAGDAGSAVLAISQMTVGEVMRRQSLGAHDPERLFAVGKFQMIPGTLREAAAHLHVDANAPLTPELQERMFAEYLVSDKRPAVRSYVTGPGGAQALGSAQLALAQEFASVADPRTGRSYYDGDSAGNHSSISAGEVQHALDRMRELYRSNVARGLAPAEAYAAIGGGAPSRVPGAVAPTGEPLLRDGARGDDVHRLQQRLHDRGVTDSAGRPVVIDGEFGQRTAEAIRGFQRAHGLHVDGVAGRETWSALEANVHAAPSPPLGDPRHPDAALLRQATSAMDRLEASIGRVHDATTERASALLVVAARREGLTSIEHVLLADDGRRLFAVQGELGSPLSRMAFVDTDQATRQSVADSTRELAGLSPAPDGERTQAPPVRALAH
ncbi:peptidoglycan-binding domain-containing protein, partial [Cognatilysobacter lacus]